MRICFESLKCVRLEKEKEVYYEDPRSSMKKLGRFLADLFWFGLEAMLLLGVLVSYLYRAHNRRELPEGGQPMRKSWNLAVGGLYWVAAVLICLGVLLLMAVGQVFSAVRQRVVGPPLLFYVKSANILLCSRLLKLEDSNLRSKKATL